MDNNWQERFGRALGDSNYFYEVLEVLFYENDGEAERVTELNMDMFREFCRHVQSTYQNLFVGAENPRHYMMLVEPYISLAKIAFAPVYIDSAHETLQAFAEFACEAISLIQFVGSTEDELLLPASETPGDGRYAVLYDFEKDSPEAVWERVERWRS